eukprot:6491237-Amphidinium_carterae.1
MAGHSGEEAARLRKASLPSRFKTVFKRGSPCPDTKPRMRRRSDGESGLRPWGSRMSQSSS